MSHLSILWAVFVTDLRKGFRGQAFPFFVALAFLAVGYFLQVWAVDGIPIRRMPAHFAGAIVLTFGGLILQLTYERWKR